MGWSARTFEEPRVAARAGFWSDVAGEYQLPDVAGPQRVYGQCGAGDFDVVLLWDTANYLPAEMVPALFQRLREVLRPEGRLLAFFHGRETGPGTEFSRYQLTDSDNLLLLESGAYPIRKVYQTRQIE
jgi:SAM-dependent methyltransferase